ncbi:DsbA family protein [Jannaschia donghaensis]|uniref:Thiol:disulfide interchange protein DsbA n=1 Tax=Jannaschia donghaensis TaxID=420998 RepID=A0A0M6YJB3_9RHOB|nr:DsbA family protein [Jannaschia donghaensis]CTQ49745.1 Thiol:disulfide interchange protein DsbA precursor [Jannaschia donghaensis]
MRAPNLPFLATLAVTCAVAAPVSAQQLTPEDVKELALEAILENPDIIMEAVAILQARDAAEAEAQAQATLSSSRDTLTNDPNAPVVGNPNGSVTVVEFFDYNCGFCRRAGPELEALMAADPDVRVVYREWPILSEGSVFGARAALAARAQDKYEEMHKALMGSNTRIEEATVMQIAVELGLDVDRLRTDMDSDAVNEHIDTTRRLAESLGFTGTPSFVIGDTRVPGFVEADRLQEIVDQVRDDG